jgi:hypothetical protein
MKSGSLVPLSEIYWAAFCPRTFDSERLSTVTSIVTIPRINVTHEAETNAALAVPPQSTSLSLFFKLLAIPNSRGVTTMPERTRVTKERNETIVSGATQKRISGLKPWLGERRKGASKAVLYRNSPRVVSVGSRFM